ncbi:MAG: hypothetical protein HY840_13945 [Bacteroidetes bacterium]|nr:hypothetical protein [Bacteroidota bacterium]
MKRLIYVMAILGLFAFSKSTFGQLLDEKDVTITMDLQPILQLNMVGSDQLDFVFDDIRKYYAGITRYGATQLKVSSTVNWDLYAVGYSMSGTNFEQVVKYGAGTGLNSIDGIKCHALEIHQTPNNAQSTGSTGLWADYDATFSLVTAGTTNAGINGIYSSATPYTAPALTEKYIFGHKVEGSGSCGLGGSYLTATNAVTGTMTGVGTSYYFILDYRILPGLPVVFPMSGTNANAQDGLTAGSYAQPGVYQMNVKYIIVEDLP